MSVEKMGELFWESGVQPVAAGRKLLYFSGMPLHGKSPENSVLIGVLDSGIAQSHPQLAGYVRAYADFSGDGLEDRLGHGTAVALQLLYGNGESNPPIAILSAKVTDAQGRISQKAVVDAIKWVAQQGARFVNLSLGFRGGADKHQDFCAAIARHPAILFIAAAGNYGPNTEVCPAACGLGNVLAVGATDASGKVAEYSGVGKFYAPGKAVFQEEWFYYYERGQAHARSGHLQEARREYEASLAAQLNAESEYQLGVLDLSEGKPEESINRFTEAIRLNRSLAEAHEMLGAAFMLLGQYKNAEDVLRSSIELYPQNATSLRRRAGAHFNLGQTLVILARPEDARVQFETVKALMPDYPNIDDSLESVSAVRNTEINGQLCSINKEVEPPNIDEVELGDMVGIVRGGALGGLLGPSDETEVALTPPEIAVAMAAPSQEKRYLNAGIKDRQHNEPLAVDETYLLEFGVDIEKGASFAARLPDNKILFKDNETTIDLTIQLDGGDFDIAPSLRTLRLPRYGASKKISFAITPKQERRSTLTATVHKDGNFILEMELAFPVGSKDSEGTTTSVHGRFLSAAQYLKPRELGLRFKPVESGYECTIWGAVSNQVVLPLNSVEITALVNRARAAMMDVVMYTDANNNKIFQTLIDIDTTSSAAALHTLAFAGAELFQGLFYGPQAGPDVMKVGDYLMNLAIKDNSVKLQIVAERFPVPWGLLYFGETRSGAKLDWNNFLGMRHIIEQIPRQATMLVDDYEIMSNNPSLSVSLNMNASIDTQMKFDAVARQVKDWEQRSESSKGMMVLTQRQTKTDLLAALSSLSNDQLMYFYCHANTANPVDPGGPWSSFIELTNRERVTLAELNREAPMREALPGNPLIFLNACESAEISPEFYDGFVPYFMAKGARGVVGTECKTPALFATEWALLFFPRFLAGAPLGELFLELRQEFCKQHGNPLGLLYTVYCNGDTYIKPALN